MVESQPSKLLVAGSIPVSRSIRLRASSEPATRYGAMPRRSPGGAKADPARFLAVDANRPADVSAEARSAKADVAQLAERVLGKDEVTSSILVIGSRDSRQTSEDSLTWPKKNSIAANRT